MEPGVRERFERIEGIFERAAERQERVDKQLAIVAERQERVDRQLQATAKLVAQGIRIVRTLAQDTRELTTQVPRCGTPEAEDDGRGDPGAPRRDQGAMQIATEAPST